MHAAAGDAQFSLRDGPVDLGAFSYDLVQRGNDWFLDGASKMISPGTASVLALYSAAPTVWYGELSSLRSRMGDNMPMPTNDTRKALLQIHFCVLLWGITAILGAGFDPGVVNAYARLAKDEYLDKVTDVDIVDIAPVGNYAIKPTFSDGHDSGLYSWDYLYALGRDQEALWNDYLEALERTGGTRDPAKVPPPAPKGGCGHHH